MQRKLFGTDGVRGRANSTPMTAEMALRLAMVAGVRLRTAARHRPRVVIAKDTRLSGYLLEPALTAGFISIGMDVVLVGPLPTPGVAHLTRSMRADLGVMVSASHNPYADNGIKLFGPDGHKLSDADEAAIEAQMEQDPTPLRVASRHLGRAQRLEDGKGRYMEMVKRTFPKDLGLDGLKIVVDCAHGAAYRVAPTVLFELGAEVVPMGVQPDGFNINQKCGATDPEALQRQVSAQGADIGLALDGDADRLIVCDENANIVDGDQIMGLIAHSWQKAGLLRGKGIVATVMSNLGLERFLLEKDLHLARTKVGDRYVVERMRADGYNVGGEQSGHLVFMDHATTGDGLIAALQVLAELVRSGRPASEVTHMFEPVPQLLRNVLFHGGQPLEEAPVKAAIAEAEASLGSGGRLVIRASGTEPKIRIMAEGDEESVIHAAVDRVAAAVEAAAGSLTG